MQNLSCVIDALGLFAVPFAMLAVMACGLWRELRRSDDGGLVLRLLNNDDDPSPWASLKMTELLANAIDRDVLDRLEVRALSNRRSVADEHRALLHAALSRRRRPLPRFISRVGR
jgi:plasmid stability protein